MYFKYVCRNRTLKPLEIILSGGERSEEKDGGDELNQGTL
jgi:hypothetical protein